MSVWLSVRDLERKTFRTSEGELAPHMLSRKDDPRVAPWENNSEVHILETDMPQITRVRMHFVIEAET